jgi:hypothetical protein
VRLGHHQSSHSSNQRRKPIIGTTVIEMAENLEEYRARADGWLAEVVAAPGKQHDDLDAFELVLKRVNAQLFQEP